MKKSQNSKKRGANAPDSAYKVVNGMPVEPCVYKGGSVNHGTYVAAKFEDGKLVMDKNGKPIPYRMLVNS